MCFYLNEYISIFQTEELTVSIYLNTFFYFCSLVFVNIFDDMYNSKII